MTRTTVLSAMIVVCLAMTAPSHSVADDSGNRRGEVGVQIGVRRADSDIVPDGDSGLAFAYGVEGAWAFNHKWALFLDLNFSDHDSRQFCEDNPNCNALTPLAHNKVLTFGMERRFKPGPKGGQWVFGLGTGMTDIEWNGAQIHHGILSFNAGRRRPLGPGTLRWTLRVETAFSGRTDAQFYGKLDWARLTSVVALVGWGFDFGGHLKPPNPARPGSVPGSSAVADPVGR